MSTYPPDAGFGDSATDLAEAREFARAIAAFWWIWLVMGLIWIVASLVILQFDQASITTVSVILGIMFVVAGLQQFGIAMLTDRLRWLWAIFGVLLVIAGMVCFFNPEDTFAGLADALGFLFLLVGILWAVRAFIERPVNPLWWLGLISAVLMLAMAFWTSGQFFIEKAYVLLVFAGIWALLHGIGDIVRAFMVRGLRDAI